MRMIRILYRGHQLHKIATTVITYDLMEPSYQDRGPVMRHSCTRIQPQSDSRPTSSFGSAPGQSLHGSHFLWVTGSAPVRALTPHGHRFAYGHRCHVGLVSIPQPSMERRPVITLITGPRSLLAAKTQLFNNKYIQTPIQVNRGVCQREA